MSVINGNKKIIIAGAGRFGSRLSGILSERGFDVTIIEKDKGHFRRIPEIFSGFDVLGDATDVDILEQNGIKKTDIFIATTEDDNVNLFLADVAKKIYGVSNVILRLKNNEKRALLIDDNINVVSPVEMSLATVEAFL